MHLLFSITLFKNMLLFPEKDTEKILGKLEKITEELRVIELSKNERTNYLFLVYIEKLIRRVLAAISRHFDMLRVEYQQLEGIHGEWQCSRTAPAGRDSGRACLWPVRRERGDSRYSARRPQALR